jgi:carbonic anhydrase/acetyltransferase-like protein (isoleucine patch superfamily)
MSVYSLADRQPQLAAQAWIAPTAILIGSVTVGEHSSIWWNTVIRADTECIVIGTGSNIQDGCVLHADPGVPLNVGDHVTIGHMAMLHGCTISEGSLIGIKSVVLNGAVIGRDCLIGANSLIPEGKVIPDRSLVLGSPGRIVRTLSDEEVAELRSTAAHYVDNAMVYRASLKSRD